MMKRVLVANRAEIAIRVIRAVAALGWESVTVYSKDDTDSLHRYQADLAIPIEQVGPVAYRDAAQLVEIAVKHRCELLHPGIGFLSEQPELARQCEDAGVSFVGPHSSVLKVWGDKVAARKLAESSGVPVLQSADLDHPQQEAHAFLESLPEGRQAVLKARAGGGGRGMRVIAEPSRLNEVLSQCRAEAETAFGDGSLYMEEYVPHARHVEVQLIGDGTQVSHMGTRECSLQRRFQKLVEIAPAPWLLPSLEREIVEAAQVLGQMLPFQGLVTMEFLVDSNDSFFFLEANPRLQVEHTVTEEVTGVDLVQAQLQLARGATLQELGLLEPPEARGIAIQARVNMEQLLPNGDILPSHGTLAAFSMPSGPGVRIDTMGYSGYTPSAAFDSLLAKVIVTSRQSDFRTASRKMYRALCETHIDGLTTNLPLLRSLLSHPDVVSGKSYTTFVEEHLDELTHEQQHPLLSTPLNPPIANALLDSFDSLPDLDEDEAIFARMDGTITECHIAVGDVIHREQTLLVTSAMKMEHVISASFSATVLEILVEVGQTVRVGQPLLRLQKAEASDEERRVDETTDLELIRPDLSALLERQAQKLDEARPKAVEKRHKRGGRTARENLTDLCDAESLREYGGLALAAQRGTKEVEELIHKTPADGIIVGVATINSDLFGDDASRCAVLSYDYTVYAGTQGFQGHRKTDRILQVAHEAKLPVVFFTEGGGGRPNDTDLLNIMISGLECASFREFASLQGFVPLIGINHGRCFAGNAALLGCCDVIIATEASNIGMGGPAMIEGGGLGMFPPEAIGPIEDQVNNGVVDIVVKDEAEAVTVAKKVLSYTQGSLPEWSAADTRLLRHLVPENRLRVYDVKRVIEAMFDTDSVMELQPNYGPGMVTAFARLEGKPVGVIANNPTVLAGAIDTVCARKACRMMKLCEQFSLPLVLLCDTPGFMVGPEAEKTGTVRAAAEMFVTSARLTVPFATVVLRKGYGLGAQAMAGGHFKAPRFLVSWPTGEFGPMGLEGAVKLGFRRQLEAIESPKEREDMFRQMVDMLYERGQALNIATHFEIDDVIDPADTRRWLTTLLSSV